MSSPILSRAKLGFPWQTVDPFLFCVHHKDHYPPGNERLGPAASLSGRNLGQDFEGKDGWRMYHGKTIPGFPQHPHRGFETITVMRVGYVDHSDSLGAAARFGAGDTQWMTAGSGIVHSEMFPLLNADGPNPLEFFQIWLNLPGADKMVAPHFSMLWSRMIPRVRAEDSAGRATLVTVVAGDLQGGKAPSPPPHSWAARTDTDVAIWSISMQPDAEWTLPKAVNPATLRTLYFFEGSGLEVAGEVLESYSAAVVDSGENRVLKAGPSGAEILLLQGRPIDEPIAQYGPFVMNDRAEIEQAFADYRRTGFGGWPWETDGPVHGPEERRFARHADGRLDPGA